MAGLGLNADPDGWLNAGYSISALMDSLESELDDADRVGGSGLTAHWAGPVADAYGGHWGALRPRAEDLIGQGRRAASAITDFGGKLEDFVKRAADLEGHWTSFGLQLAEGGLRFALPFGFDLLPQEHQLSFRQLLAESEQDVTAMWSDIKAAVDDVVTLLESLIDAFEDFAVLEVGMAAGLLGGYLGGYRTNWASLASDALSVVREGFDDVAPRALDGAYHLVVGAGEDASRGAQAVADVSAKLAVGSAKAAGVLDDLDKFGGPVLYVATVGVTAWQTYKAVSKHGWLNGGEDEAGAWAGLAAGIAITVLAPVSAPVIGVVLVAGIVGYGVSYGVQHWVDDNRTSINQGFSDLGQGAEVTAKAVGHGAEAVGHGLGDAAEWGASHAEGLADLL